MPTGYTAGVVDGKITEFRDFALTCARAFGALIEMRGDPLDTPIPEDIKVSFYYAEVLKKANDEVARLTTMSEPQRLAFGDEKRTEAIAMCEAAIVRETHEGARIRNMIAKAEAWTPPTSEHVEMKTFMLQQLNETLKFDDNTKFSEARLAECLRKTSLEFYEEALAAGKRQIEYATSEAAKELERYAGRNQWLKDLRNSLEPAKEEAPMGAHGS